MKYLVLIATIFSLTAFASYIGDEITALQDDATYDQAQCNLQAANASSQASSLSAKALTQSGLQAAATAADAADVLAHAQVAADRCVQQQSSISSQISKLQGSSSSSN